MPTAFDLTVYVLIGALVLLGLALGRLLPRVPDSGGVQGLRFWLALILGVALARVLNTTLFTIQTALYDAPDAGFGLIQAALLYGLTMRLLKRPVDGD